jgi:hypothetical protein
MKRLLVTILLSLATACGSSNNSIVRQTNPVSSIDQKLLDFGSEVCKDPDAFGEEWIDEDHDRFEMLTASGMIKVKKLPKWMPFSYGVQCGLDGSYLVGRLDTKRSLLKRLNLPKKLSFDNLKSYVRNKKAVLFGERHGADCLEDNLKFLSLIPEMKQMGYTHVGLEITSTDVRYINLHLNGYLTKEEVMKTVSLYSNADLDYSIKLIKVAKETGLSVLPFNTPNRIQKYPGEREKYMANEIGEVVDCGGKVVVFIGRAHVAAARTTHWTNDRKRFSKRISAMGIPNPVAMQLIDKYGQTKVGLIDLTNGKGTFIPNKY